MFRTNVRISKRISGAQASGGSDCAAKHKSLSPGGATCPGLLFFHPSAVMAPSFGPSDLGANRPVRQVAPGGRVYLYKTKKAQGSKPSPKGRFAKEAGAVLECWNGVLLPAAYPMTLVQRAGEMPAATLPVGAQASKNRWNSGPSIPVPSRWSCASGIEFNEAPPVRVQFRIRRVIMRRTAGRRSGYALLASPFFS